MKKKKRTASIKRKTKETDISVKFNVDGKGKSKISAGIAFLDHMLTLFSKHGLFDLEIKAKGDLDVDIHHTNEDVAISLGIALSKALGKKAGIRRFGSFTVPMDEALARVSLDISGRPSLNVHKGKAVKLERQEGYSLTDAKEFLKAFTQNSGVNLAIEIVSGNDLHHVIEAVFKALGKSLDVATQIDKRVKGVPSTKGRL